MGPRNLKGGPLLDEWSEERVWEKAPLAGEGLGEASNIPTLSARPLSRAARQCGFPLAHTLVLPSCVNMGQSGWVLVIILELGAPRGACVCI